jgi:succinoglycan biosynthesis protein ExoM
MSDTCNDSLSFARLNYAVRPNQATMTSEVPHPSEPLLSFLICTYHREDLLELCIRSIQSQKDIDADECEIIVVDNSDEGTAAAVVSRLAKTSTVPIKYVQAHPANIAVARNAGVRAASAEFVGMIDDDMVVDADWYSHARAALKSLHYDVYSGPVYPMYEDPKQATSQSDAFFHRHMDVVSPTPLRIMGSQRTRGYIPATSNSIFKRARCFSDAPAFDTHYGKSGGEDVDLFCRLEAAGRIFAWLPDIKTHEHVPSRRCDIDYLEKRSFVGGQIFASTYIRNSKRPEWTQLKVTLIATLQVMALTPWRWMAHFLPSSKANAIRLRQSAVRGKLAWRVMIPIYSQEKKRVN